MKELFLGIDVGSVSTNLVLMNPDKSVEEKIYIRTVSHTHLDVYKRQVQ